MAIRTLELDAKGTFSGIFGRPRILAWPIHAYRVTIPDRDKSEYEKLNPFERVILNLLGTVGGMTEHELAKEICIPVDLVRNVLFRLRDKEFIDEDNQIKDAHHIALRDHKREERYVTALAFRELVGGKILPFVKILEGSNALKTKTAAEYSKQLQQRVRLGPPSIREVINAISQMTRRTGHTQQTLPPLEGQVKIVSEPEAYLLECEIVIQKHDADFRIGNPFGEGFSRVLESVFSQRLDEDAELQQWMKNWMNRLTVPTSEDQVRAPFDTPETRRRFPNLVKSLKPGKGKQHRNISNIYHSLEWALFYTCRSYNSDIAIRRLELETGPDYSQWMCNIARSMGFEALMSRFRPVLKGRFVAFRKSSAADMETVLAICLLQAESLRDHPLHRVASIHPDFLIRLRSIKQERDGSAHGRDSARTSSNIPLESDAFMVKVVHTLFPSICLDTDSLATPSVSQADHRLEARTSLLYRLDHSTFNKLGPSAQEALLNAELFWCMVQDGDDAREFVFNLYSVLQGVLRRCLTGVSGKEILEDRYHARASERAERAGLGRLPQELETVNLRRIRETLQGADHTLGASAWALLLKANDDFLERLGLSDADFLTTIASIHIIRGHGNEPVPLPKDAVSKLRRSALASIEALLTNED